LSVAEACADEGSLVRGVVMALGDKGRPHSMSEVWPGQKVTCTLARSS
jgi:hypothetical protein